MKNNQVIINKLTNELHKLPCRFSFTIKEDKIEIRLFEKLKDFDTFCARISALYVKLTNDPIFTMNYTIIIYNENKTQYLKINKKTGWIYAQIDKQFEGVQV